MSSTIVSILPYLSLYALAYKHPTFLDTYAVAKIALITTVCIIIHRVILTAYLRYTANKKKAMLVPTVRTFVPFNLDLLIERVQKQGKTEPGDFFKRFFDQYKSDTVYSNVLFRGQYMTKDPIVMKHVLTGNTFPNFGKGPFIKQSLTDFLGDGIFTSDPDSVWKFHRGLTKPFFSKDRVTDFKLDHIDKMIKVSKQLLQTNQALDVQELFSRLNFDSSSDFLFAFNPESLDALLKENSPTSEFAHAFDTATFKAAKSGLLGAFKPVYEALYGKLLEEPLSVLNPLVDNMVYEALVRQSEKRDSETKVKPEELPCVLDYLVTQTQDRKLIRDELLNLMLAGRDTTSTLLTALFLQFAKNPEIYQKTRDDVINLFGEDGEPDFQTMRDNRFFRALLNETLRVFPSVPVNTRFSFEDVVVPTSNGTQILIKGGANVSYSIWHMQRDSANWGPDADIWDPYRWLDDRIKHMTSNPFIFQPFSAGPRLCLGQQLAYNQATLTMIRMCQAFEKIEVLPEVQDSFVPVSQITLRWKDGKRTNSQGKLEDGLYLKLVPASK